jgi:hypothetical protein
MVKLIWVISAAAMLFGAGIAKVTSHEPTFEQRFQPAWELFLRPELPMPQRAVDRDLRKFCAWTVGCVPA